MGIWRFIGKIPGTGGSGETNFRPLVNLGMAVRSVIRTKTDDVDLGISIQNPFKSLITSRNTVGLEIQNRSSGSTQPETDLGIEVRSTNEVQFDNPFAVSLDLVDFELDSTFGAGSQTNTGTWTDPNNAVGKSNGTNATTVGDALNARTATMNLQYVDRVGKEMFSIDTVTARITFTHQVTLNNSSRRFVISWTGGSYDSGVITTTSEVSTQTVDLKALGVDTWAKINSLQSNVTVTFQMGAITSNFALDAIEINVTGSYTDTLE